LLNKYSRTSLLMVLILVTLVQAPASTYPGKKWDTISRPEDIGWSSERLAKAREFTRSLDTAAVVVVVDGKILTQWGKTKTRYNMHSCRKSLMSAMIGIRVHDGTIDLNQTLEQLNIKDNEPRLSMVEKQATVENLLQARSGIYHPALYETPSMRSRKPQRGSHSPGTFFYYNNWDFNALGSILEMKTGRGLFHEFKENIADPIQMQDFRLRDCEYVHGADSWHPAYPFRMSARDMARFGLLFARGGEWRGRQIIPRQWVERSTQVHSIVKYGNKVHCGYGYMWWVAYEGKCIRNVVVEPGEFYFTARGAHGHYILVYPKLDLVVVHRVNSDKSGIAVRQGDFGKMVSLILEARPGCNK
jgi:CubicO group peptidase (beta-lactamase class C family)